MGGWSNESFTMLLKMLKEELLPDGADLPNSYYEAKKVIRDLGLSYHKIDACVNDCMLYWKEDNLLDSCKVCGASRWKIEKHSGEAKNRKGKKIASKTLRYFSLKPRLQRLFMSTKTSSLMTWHHDERVDDGIMRHPADSMAWKSFDELHPSFTAEPRNVRLGLASDGFQPFRNSKTSYSIWPVSGDAIDIYLQPLIEELRELWEFGIETFDASTRQNFKLRASLLWTINDFPAYGNLSGWSTKGKLACPCCNKDTYSIRLANSKKQCFMGHRCYLPLNHKWRNDRASFDGTKEKRLPPKMRSGVEILNQVQDLEGFHLTKDPKKRIKISHDGRKDNWNKKSIFFELPYWKSLLLRHNLDDMHIEKNICDYILGTIMNAKGKTKDTINTRLDLQEMNIRSELHPIKKGEKYEIPTACYTLSPQEKHNLCLFLKNLKVPNGFSSNISQCVNLKYHKIFGLKSHDCHVLLQHLLPLALRGMLSKTVCEPLVELCLFFNVLGAKLMKLSFFGPVQYRWMYPIERWLYFLKSLIGNKACPEGSIAEGYLANECMTLCSRYRIELTQSLIGGERNYDGGLPKSDGGLSLFCKYGKTLGAPKQCDIEADELEQAHIYILKNCDEVLPFLEEFAQIHVDVTQHLSDAEWNRQFIEWFKDRVAQLHKGDNSRIMEDLLALSRGPTPYVLRYNGHIVNGYRFHVEDYDKHLRTQNYGVVVVGEIDEHRENIDYCGVLTDVLELQFTGRRVILFESDQGSQVFYASDNSNKGWRVVRKTQPRDFFEVVQKLDDDVVDLENPTQNKRKRTTEVKFDIQPSKNENEVESTVKATEYVFVTP
ncbi:uncharacterized protein LOC132046040, partial [Lycium ferocissimum]|uniref:uncharacterized protein LOC132046040 n=1 Tax=Lycium ferocissimum TaxID=112874 RepID=UPI002815B0A9